MHSTPRAVDLDQSCVAKRFRLPSSTDAPITIRNLTAQPLTVKLVERCAAPSPGSSILSWITSLINLWSHNTFVGSTTPPSNSTLSGTANSFTKQDVDVRIEPFTTHETDTKLTPHLPKDILRFTFEDHGGGRWRLEIPTPSSASQTLTPLTRGSRHEYTSIYNPSTSFLALHESVDLSSWMKEFKNETPLSALSVPGTHNSPTHYNALPSVRCQAVGVAEQLQNGIRFFDIRVQPANNGSDPNDETLTLVHGAFPISLTGPKKFRHVVDKVRHFLDKHPSETVIMSIKREGIGNATDQQLAEILKDHYAIDDKWHTEPRIPHLGEVRGKIVLMRRFALSDRLKGEHDSTGWCLNAEDWAYNTPNCHYGDVCVQDFCEVLETESIDKKIQLCCEHFEHAAAVVNPVPGITTDAQYPAPPGPLYLNFLSASNFWKVGCWPDKIAARLNPAVTTFLCERHDVGVRGVNGLDEEFQGDGGVGIVVCDWVGKDGDWDLVRCIVSMNSRLLLRQRGTAMR